MKFYIILELLNFTSSSVYFIIFALCIELFILININYKNYYFNNFYMHRIIHFN